MAVDPTFSSATKSVCKIPFCSSLTNVVWYYHEFLYRIVPTGWQQLMHIQLHETIENTKNNDSKLLGSSVS